MNKRVRLALHLLAFVAVFLVAGCGVNHIARGMMFPGCPVAFDTAGLDPSELVSYTAKDGTKLQGAWIRCGGADPLVVVHFHGNAESSAQNVGFARALARREHVDVFLAEYRGYGGLAGSPTEKGLYQDGVAALEALYAAGVPRDRIVLVGRSLGTGVAVELASRGHGAAVILLTPYTSMPDMAAHLLGSIARMFVADKFDSASKIAALKIPVVVIHGTRDEVIPYAMGERLATMATPPARFVPLEDAGHQLGGVDLVALVGDEIRGALAVSGSGTR